MSAAIFSGMPLMVTLVPALQGMFLVSLMDHLGYVLRLIDLFLLDFPFPVFRPLFCHPSFCIPY